MPPTILIVDDMYTSRLFMKICLEKESFQVIEANNGKMALDTIYKTIPDLIIMDMQMPEMDGPTCCRALKKMDRTQAIPVIMVTFMDSNEVKQMALGSGCDDFISKPFKRVELLSKVRRLLKGHNLEKETTDPKRSAD